MSRSLRGKVLTVCGPKEPDELGVVLPHEQPMCDLRNLFKEPELGFGGGESLADLKLQICNLGKVRQYPYSVKANLITDNVEETISELGLFKAAGGGTVCDVSPIGVRLNRESLPHIAQETGLHMVASTGLYVDPLMSEQHKAMTIEEISDLLVGEIMGYISGCAVRCGIIGEVGCSSPISVSEYKSLVAAVRAQQRTGAPIMIHTGRDESSPFEILRVLEEANADLSHVAFGHMDRTLSKEEDLLKLARNGCYIEYDFFGIECSHFQLNPSRDFPSDADRINKVKLLVDSGFSDQILISSDLHTKHRQVCYGGHGYAHILHYVVPKMASRGVDKETMQKITTTNPQRWLTFH